LFGLLRCADHNGADRCVAGSSVGESAAEHLTGRLLVGAVRTHEQFHIHRFIVPAALHHLPAARRRSAGGTADQPADGEGHRHGDREEQMSRLVPGDRRQ